MDKFSHIRLRDIRKGLRLTGAVIRMFAPRFTERIFRMGNRFLDTFVSGKRLRGLSSRQVFLPRPGGGSLRVCIYRAKGVQKQDVPGVLWLHGGGFALGAPEQDAYYIRSLIGASGCVVVSPDYRRSVDAPYPAALTDCYAALEYMRAHAGEYGIREDQLFVGGDSAGGGLAAALTLLARDRDEIAIAFQMPLYPMLDDRMLTPLSQNNDAPVWNTASNECAWKLYLGDLYQTDGVPAYAAPARADDLSRLPPAVTFVGSIEPFCDEVTAYVRRLAHSGIPVQFRKFEGCYHAFDQLARHARVSKEAHTFFMEAFTHAVAHCFAKQPDCIQEERL